MCKKVAVIKYIVLPSTEFLTVSLSYIHIMKVTQTYIFQQGWYFPLFGVLPRLI